ncbi:MAG: phospholipase D-like domain-containing protein, partial [Syntrophales bacterium]
GDRHLAGRLENPSRVIDTHFRLEGPVAKQIEHVFLEDWGFTTGERSTNTMENDIHADGTACRVITDGPNEDMDKLATILVGAISLARRQILIMTPYFLPSRELIAALQATALRGVEVRVILPSLNNLPFVHWASMKMLWELLQIGIKIHYQPPPFVHTKLFIIDDCYAHIGSANMDPRSMRLNFELVVEIYDKSFIKRLSTHVEKSLNNCREIFLEDLDNRSLPVMVRDAAAWLFTPYL